MSNILFFCHLERNQKGTQKKYWYQKQVLLSGRAVLRDAVCLENATLEKWAQRESRQTGRQSQETGLLPPATRIQSPQWFYERLRAPSSQALLIDRVIHHQKALLRLFMVSNINHKINYVGYRYVMVGCGEPARSCHDPFITPRVTVTKPVERWYNIACY